MHEVYAFYVFYGFLLFLGIIYTIWFLCDHSRYIRIRKYCESHGYKYQSQTAGMPECLQNYLYKFESKILTNSIGKEYCAIMSGKYKEIDFNIIECIEIQTKGNNPISFYSQIFLLSKENQTLHKFYEPKKDYQCESNGKAYLAYYKTTQKFEAEDRMFNLDWLSNDLEARILEKSNEDKLLSEIKLKE